MNIMDYAHYYVEQSVILKKYNAKFSKWGWCTNTPYHFGKCKLWDFEDEGYTDFVLILNRLEDMTEEQAIELVKLDEWYIHGEHPHKRVYETYRNSFGQIVVSWGDSMNEKNVPIEKNIFTPREIHYLIRNGFDLFGLIKAGLAVDRKTIAI